MHEVCIHKSPCGVPLFCHIFRQNRCTPEGDVCMKFIFSSRLAVCLYFVIFFDKIDTHQKAIYAQSAVVKIVSRCASILSHFTTKMR